ncbi:MAG: hypothetical protein ACREO5_02100 [Candidatus Binatia bacterium]
MSPLLANIYRYPVDRQMKQRGYRMVRYADDFVVLCQTAEQAQRACGSEELGRTKRPETQRRSDPCRGLSANRSSFEFLGYRFEAGRRWFRRKSFLALRERIRLKTKRTRGDSLAVSSPI